MVDVSFLSNFSSVSWFAHSIKQVKDRCFLNVNAKSIIGHFKMKSIFQIYEIVNILFKTS